MNVGEVPTHSARQILDHLVQTGQPPRRFVQSLTVGYEDLLDTIEGELLDDLVANGFGSVRVIIAQNGNGKTHLCRDIVERATQRNYATAEIDLTPERELSSPSSLYTMIANQVTFTQHDGTTSQGLAQILRREAHPDVVRDEERLSGTYRRAAAALAVEDLASDDLDLLAQWIHGEPVPTSDRRNLELKVRLSDRNAMGWIRNLAILCTAIGSNGLVVVLDEAETTVSTARKRLQTRLSVMLDIINSVTAGDLPHTLFLFTGVSGSFTDQWDSIKPVRQRILPDLPFTDYNRNPRTIRITADDTGGVPEEEWLRRVAGKVQSFGEKADMAAPGDRSQQIDAIIDETLGSPAALNKRKFIREVAEVVIRG